MPERDRDAGLAQFDETAAMAGKGPVIGSTFTPVLRRHAAWPDTISTGIER